ncbi:HK97 gp10 family phage protein [Rufibacter soli]
MKLQLKGMEKAIAQIGKFRLQKLGAIANELDRAALMVESGAKKNLTINKSVKTNRLRSSIVRQEYGRWNRTVGTNVEYAPFVEFGTFRSRAKPYLYPAAEAERQRFLENLRRILNTP